MNLGGSPIHIQQRLEMAEFLGYETRNKYEIKNSKQEVIGFAAEQGKEMRDFLMRQTFGHWRDFELIIFTPQRQALLRCHHPFRWFFQQIDVFDIQGRFHGRIKQRFGVFHKIFDISGPQGEHLYQMRSPLFKIWSFPIFRGVQEVAAIYKKWSGVLTELATDQDRFEIQISSSVPDVHRMLIVIAGLFVDLQYFERRASRR